MDVKTDVHEGVVLPTWDLKEEEERKKAQQSENLLEKCLKRVLMELSQ